MTRHTAALLSALLLVLALLAASPAQAQGDPEDPESGGGRPGGDASLNAQAEALYHGAGVPKDRAKAAQLYISACKDNHAPACINAGYVLRRGDGVPADLPQAATHFRRACDLGDRWGCLYLRETCADLEGKGAASCKDIDRAPYAELVPQRGFGGGGPSLSRQQIMSVMRPLEVTIRQKCKARDSGAAVVRLRITISPNGRVSNATLLGDVPASVAPCVVRHVRAARFPASGGSPMAITYPIRLD